MGTWIEIRILSVWQLLDNVVPYVGTWIEIVKLYNPSGMYTVVPYVGTWIEMRIQHPSST